MTPNGPQMLASCDESHVMAGLREATAEITPGATRAEHGDTHAASLGRC